VFVFHPSLFYGDIMADQMYLVITIRKPVPDRETGSTIFQLVKQRLEDRPDLEISGHVTNHFNLEEPT